MLRAFPLLILLLLLLLGDETEGAVLLQDKRVEGVTGKPLLIHYRVVDNGIRSEADVCVSLERTYPPPRETVLRESCFSIHTDGPLQSMKLDGIKPGRYEAHMRLREEGAEGAPPSILLVEVQTESEIRPSYNWQALHAWHTIPTGLETRLPLDASGLGTKECRIPEPWRLQLAFPYPCKFFLRLDISRLTSIDDILLAAAKSCKLPHDCFQLVDLSSHATLDPQETAESSDLFNRPAVKLRLSENCVQL